MNYFYNQVRSISSSVSSSSKSLYRLFLLQMRIKRKSSFSSSDSETKGEEDSLASSEADSEDLEDKAVIELDKYNADLKNETNNKSKNAVAALDYKLMCRRNPTITIKETGTRSKIPRDRKESITLKYSMMPNDPGTSTSMTSASGTIPKNVKTSSQSGRRRTLSISAVEITTIRNDPKEKIFGILIRSHGIDITNGCFLENGRSIRIDYNNDIY